MANVEHTFTKNAKGQLTKTPMDIWTLYGGDVQLGFLTNSHQYRILKVKDLDASKLKKLNDTKSSGTSAPGYIDKSRQLIPWAVDLYTETVEKLMGDGTKFTRDDVEAMLKAGANAHTIRKKDSASIGTVAHKFAEDFAHHTLDGTIPYDENTGEYSINPEVLLEMYASLKNEFEDEFDNWDDEVWPKAMKSIEAFIAWVQQYRPVFRKPEQACYSMKNNHVGFYDTEFELLERFVGKDLAGLYLGDVKTSNGIYDEHEYQLSSYLKAREEEEEYIGNKDFKYKGGAIMAFYKEDKHSKDGELLHSAGEFVFKIYSRKELMSNYKVYKATMVVEQDKKVKLAQWRANNKKS
jgi:hypothetical protein